MSNFYQDFLGVDEETYKNLEDEKASSGSQVIDSGVYTAKIKEIGKFKGNNGGVQLKISVIIPELIDHELTKYAVLQTKDGKPSEWGAREFKHVMDALNVDPTTLNYEKGKFEAYGKEVDAILVKGVADKPLKVCVRKVHQHDNKFEWINEIEHFCRVDGTNAKGDDIEGPFRTKIEKFPVLERKPKGGGSNNTNSATTASGTSVADLL